MSLFEMLGFKTHFLQRLHVIFRSSAQMTWDAYRILAGWGTFTARR